MVIWIDKFPLSPSVNTANVPVAGQKVRSLKTGKVYHRGRMFKSAEHVNYMKRCEAWSLINKNALDKIITALKSYKAKCEAAGVTFGLEIDCYFVFHVERIVTKSGQAQELDVDNRLKPCLDALKKALTLDDRYFFAGHYEKVTTHTKDLECVMIRIKPTTRRNLTQIRQLMRAETNTQDS